MGSRAKRAAANEIRDQHVSEIMAVPGWDVQCFNGNTHLRINGCVEIWPKGRKWIPFSRPVGTLSKTYSTIAELKEIVRFCADTKPVKAIAKPAAPRAPEPQKKEPVERVASWEEFGRRFDGPITYSPQQERLFEVQKKERAAQKTKQAESNGRIPW